MEREREERNYFQLERDKINTFWEITKRQLDESKALLRNKDREMEDMEERHQVEIKVHHNRLFNLMTRPYLINHLRIAILSII